MGLGFTAYDKPNVETQTTQEMLATMTAQDRGAVLNGFTAKKDPTKLKHELGVDKKVIIHLYKMIDAVEEFCRSLLRGEIIEQEAVYDENGELVSDTVYKAAPNSVAGLEDAVAAEFGEEFTKDQSDAIVDKMIKYSKSDGTGTPPYYLAEVTK
jgi:hypothetical protein